MPQEIDENYSEPDYEDVIKELPHDRTFIIGQCYDEKAATTLSCKKCSNTAFRVGKGTHYTAIKCTACSWQLCVHDG